MSFQATPLDPVVSLDMAGLGIAQVKLQVSYSGPSVLSFVMYAPQQSMPLGAGGFIIFWDDQGVTDGVPHTPANPTFEGFIEPPSPGDDSNIVRITCLDATNKAAREIRVMSQPWVAGNPPTTGLGAVPRLVFNAFIQGDDDYIFSRAGFLTTGNIMATLFDEAKPMTDFWNASTVGSPAYSSSDLNGFTYIPEDKVVFEGQTLRSALQSILQWEPAVKLCYFPGIRVWRFLNVYNATQRTVTLNQFTNPAGVVMSFSLNLSMKDRATAVNVYGPAETIQQTLHWSSGGLTNTSGAAVLQTWEDPSGTHTTPSLSQFTITNPQCQRVARKLLFPVTSAIPGIGLGSANGTSYQTIFPLLEGTYDNATWFPIVISNIDGQNGVINIGSIPSLTITPATSPSSQTIFAPVDVRLTYVYFGTPMSVRQPASGYSGTANTVAGAITELRLYDEMMAIGYNPWGTPVTSADRIAKYEVLANKMLEQRQNIVYSGGISLADMQYDWIRLNRCINLAALDENGSVLTTGWEAINAIVTDVEYDYSSMLTTLQFSSDHLELAGFDPDFLRKRLKIRALEMYMQTTFSYTFAQYQSKFGVGAPLTQISGIGVQNQAVYYDPLDPRHTQQKPI
jgi:hypothetical protein